MLRPASTSRYFPIEAGYSVTSAVARWFSTILSVKSNQNSDICVSTRPLSGIPFGITTSKAEMRSVATIRSWLPRS